MWVELETSHDRVSLEADTLGPLPTVSRSKLAGASPKEEGIIAGSRILFIE